MSSKNGTITLIPPNSTKSNFYNDDVITVLPISS